VTSIGYSAFDGCFSLDTIICYAIVPPIAECSFGIEAYANCQLLVPEESLDRYKEDQYEWSLFKNIGVIPEITAVESPEASYPAISHPTIYNLNGTAISGDIQSLSPGIYIIKEGGKSRKIIVR
jgi:hypothetical protein